MIKNETVVVDRQELVAAEDPTSLVTQKLGRPVLRWYVGSVRGEEARIEATTVSEHDSLALTDPGPSASTRSAVVSIIPTGIGCEIGGYAGDAAAVTSLLGRCVDYVVTNPNAVNASDFVGPLDGVLYTEGACIDLLCRGLTHLHVPAANRIGVVLERCESWRLDIAFNVINAVRAIHGVDIVDCVVTDEPIGARSAQNASGAYVGSVDNPPTLFRACEQLVAKGATALAVTTNIRDLPDAAYAEHFEGRHPNPMGGVEAIISHLMVHRFALPAAHAPMINLKGGRHPHEKRQRDAHTKLALHDEIVDPRGAGELVSASGLACVLIGLRRAPQLRRNVGLPSVDTVGIDNVHAVVAPSGALGGIPVLSAHQRGIPVIAVDANRTITEVTAEALGLERVIGVRTYAEAAGLVLALRHGISLESIGRPLRRFGHRRPETERHTAERAPRASERPDAAERVES